MDIVRNPNTIADVQGPGTPDGTGGVLGAAVGADLCASRKQPVGLPLCHFPETSTRPMWLDLPKHGAAFHNERSTDYTATQKEENGSRRTFLPLTGYSPQAMFRARNFGA